MASIDRHHRNIGEHGQRRESKALQRDNHELPYPAGIKREEILRGPGNDTSGTPIYHEMPLAVVS
jgi:hypothetical protein